MVRTNKRKGANIDWFNLILRPLTGQLFQSDAQKRVQLERGAHRRRRSILFITPCNPFCSCIPFHSFICAFHSVPWGPFHSLLCAFHSVPCGLFHSLLNALHSLPSVPFKSILNAFHYVS